MVSLCKTEIQVKNLGQVLLYKPVEESIRRLNPDLDEDGIHDALGQIHEDYYPYSLAPVDTNEKIRAKLVELSKSGGLEPIDAILEA
jgi:type I site-specific restriction-modification system R (restriction) subunit